MQRSTHARGFRLLAQLLVFPVALLLGACTGRMQDQDSAADAPPDGRTTDFVVCFECLSMQVFEDGVATGAHLTSDSPERAVTAFFASHGPTIHTDR